ncbi:MAG: GNAT family N-acetyltransferase, partial [Nonomuraea sp.]|nr:GNAT family N-acetyltransferase [Nonomuraea sp.]
NSDALGLLAADACVSAGLEPRPPVNLGAAAGPAEFGAALAGELGSADVDAAVVIYMPPIPGESDEVAAELLRVSQEAAKPVLATFRGHLGMHASLRVPSGSGRTPARGSIPSYAAPEEAVRALAHVVRYATWRAHPAVPPPELDDIDSARAKELVLTALSEAAPDAPPAEAVPAARDARPAEEAPAVGGSPEVSGRSGSELVAAPGFAEPGPPVEVDATELLSCYGLTVWPAEVVRSPGEAVAAAERLGWPVVLKVADPGASRRAGTVRLGLTGPEMVRHAYAEFADQLGERVELAVQRMAPQPAVPTVVGVVEDPAFGPVVSFGLGEVTARLLLDQGFRLAPLTGEDAAELVRSVRAAPLLFGQYGYPPVAVPALESLLVRVGRLANDLPEVSRLDLDQVLVGESDVMVLGARATLRTPAGPRLDGGPRRLS